MRYEVCEERQKGTNENPTNLPAAIRSIERSSRESIDSKTPNHMHRAPYFELGLQECSYLVADVARRRPTTCPQLTAVVVLPTDLMQLPSNTQ